MHEYFKTLKNKSLPIFRQNYFSQKKIFLCLFERYSIRVDDN